MTRTELTTLGQDDNTQHRYTVTAGTETYTGVVACDAYDAERRGRIMFIRAFGFPPAPESVSARMEAGQDNFL
jgi:hypothetical protein